MLRHSFGLESEARAVEGAVSKAIGDGCVTVDITAGGERPYSTEEVGRTIADVLSHGKRVPRNGYRVTGTG